MLTSLTETAGARVVASGSVATVADADTRAKCTGVPRRAAHPAAAVVASVPRVVDARKADSEADESLPIAQQALVESLEERNRLWEELQSLKALRHENEYLQRLLAQLEGSLSWRLTKPLRDAVQLRRDLQARLLPKKTD